MGAAAEVLIAFESATDVWTDLSDDVMISQGVSISYGIAGDKPLDMVAGTGECRFTLHGFKYSLHHADVLSGWAFGARIRVTCYRTTDTAQAISSITRSSATATVTTSASHGYATDDWITIAGAGESGYNGVFQITKTAATTFTYSVGSLTPSTPASGTKTARLGYVRHNGRLRAANPTPGAYGSRYVAVVSYDGIRALAETKVRAVAIQEDQTETELLTALLDSLPSDAQPLKRDFDTGVDTYPYAFDGLGGGKTALSVVKDIAISGFAMIYMQGDGTLCLRTRDTRASGISQFSFDDDMTGLGTNASVDELTNNVQCTLYPRTVDAAATTVIYSTTGVPLSVAAGDTLTLVVEYRSPDDDRELIGGGRTSPPICPSRRRRQRPAHNWRLRIPAPRRSTSLTQMVMRSCNSGEKGSIKSRVKHSRLCRRSPMAIRRSGSNWPIKTIQDTRKVMRTPCKRSSTQRRQRRWSGSSSTGTAAMTCSSRAWPANQMT